MARLRVYITGAARDISRRWRELRKDRTSKFDRLNASSANRKRAVRACETTGVASP